MGISFWSLLVADIAVLIWAILEKLPLSRMAWVYFFQSLMIGIFWSIRVLESPVNCSNETKVKNVSCFLPHYFLMHLIFIPSMYNAFGKEFLANLKSILVMSGFFLISEIITYFKESKQHCTRPLNLATIQLFPYARVIPMNLAIFIGLIVEFGGTISQFTVAVFLIVKTLADIAMDLVEKSYVFSNIVTEFFEKQEQNTFLVNDTDSEAKRKKCLFCQRIFSKDEKPHIMNDNLVCEQCYKKIEIEKNNN